MKKTICLLLIALSLCSCSNENKHKENLFMTKDGKPRAVISIANMDKCLQITPSQKPSWCLPHHMPKTCNTNTWQQLSHLRHFKKLQECPISVG